MELNMGWVGFGRIRELSPRPGKPRISCREGREGGEGEQAARGEAAGGIKLLGVWPWWVHDTEQGGGRAWGGETGGKCPHAWKKPIIPVLRFLYPISSLL